MSKLCRKCWEKWPKIIHVSEFVKLQHKNKQKKSYQHKLMSCHELKMIHFSCNTTSVLIWIRVWTEKPWNDAAHANGKLRHKYYTNFAIFHTWCNDSSLWSDSQNNGPVSSYIDKQHSSGEQLWSQIGSWAQQYIVGF